MINKYLVGPEGHGDDAGECWVPGWWNACQVLNYEFSTLNFRRATLRIREWREPEHQRPLRIPGRR